MTLDDSSFVLQQASELERRGALIDAYDLLRVELDRRPDDLVLAHRTLTVLARAGATDQALAEYRARRLDLIDDNAAIISLGARLLKDTVWAAGRRSGTDVLQLSIDRYAQAFKLTQGIYPAINMATLMYLAGDLAGARHYAQFVLAQGDDSPAKSGVPYFDLASRAEAFLILGDREKAAETFSQAIAASPDDLAARAVTIQQLERLSLAIGCGITWLDPFRAPVIIHFAGHMFNLDDAQTVVASDYVGLVRAIHDQLAKSKPGAAFGALAAGSDILFAEALLDQGVELNVILPFMETDFIRVSVAAFGDAWCARYQRCKEAASSFRIALPEPYLGDDGVFSYGSGYAMGLAIRRAQHLRTNAVQFIAWDGLAGGASGTAHDFAKWHQLGLPTERIEFPASLRAPAQHADAVLRLAKPRRNCASLFCDVRGFSGLSEHQVPIFVDGVMQALAQVIGSLPVQADQVETWGDGIHLIYQDASAAALAAIAMLNRFHDLDLTELGLPEFLALRIGGHYGPLTPMRDPFTGIPGYFGAHNTIAARIEPITMPGSFFASEAFSVQLALERGAGFRAEYVGARQLAKNFGALQLHSIRPGL